MTRIRALLLIEGISFVAAGLVHRGVLVTGYEHREAAIAETVIGVVLLVGFALAWLRPSRTRATGIVAQAFALLGTLVGAYTIAIGIGPRTAPDVAYHVFLVALLIGGLIVAARTRRYAVP